MEALHHQTPTQRVEAELLGICLRHPAVIDEVACVLTVDDWYLDAHQKLWRTLLQMQSQAQTITLTAVADQLHRSGQLADVGDYVGLGVLYEQGVLATHALSLARRVRDYSILRQLQRVGGQVLEMGRRPFAAPDELLAEAEKQILGIAQTGVAGQAVLLESVITETLDRLDARLENRAPTGIPTGLEALDHLTGGLQPCELIVVGARPSVGKTSLALWFALRAILDAQVPTLMVSLEQSAGELCERLLAAVSGVDGGRIRSGQFRDQVQAVIDASVVLRQAPLWIDDASAQTMTRISATARRLKRRANLGLVLVDYLQLVEPDNRKEPRHEQVARVSNRLKQLARDLAIPVVALAQLNRGVDGRVSRKPRLSDLRETGQIEQDSDTVLLMHRAEDGPADKVEVSVAKQRNGPTGDVALEYQRSLYRFADVTREPKW